MIALILGGGAGSRLYPLTYHRSKPAVPIGGKYRLIDIPISNCLNSGVREMFVLTQYNSASLNQHIKNTYYFGLFSQGFVDILAAEQTPGSDKWFEGTADAVRQTRHHMAKHKFDNYLVLSGDQLYQMDFRKLQKYHVDQNADLTIATIPVLARQASGFGIMKVNEKGFIESFVEKPKQEELFRWKSLVNNEIRKGGKDYLASMGIYLFRKGILAKLLDLNPNAVDFGKEIIPYAIEKGLKVASYPFGDYWTDIGTIWSFYNANISLTDNIPDFDLFNKTLFTRPRLLAPSKVFGTWFNQAVIAEGCIIHAKTIEHSIIGIRSRIGAQTDISNTFVMGNDFYETLEQIEDKSSIPIGIGENCNIRNAILDKGCRIGNDVMIQGCKSLEDTEEGTYCIRDGIAVIKKGAVIPDGTKIGLDWRAG